ncbi:hypothetical protein AAGS30_08955 [Shewanella sp. VAX-SP4-0CM-7]
MFNKLLTHAREEKIGNLYMFTPDEISEYVIIPHQSCFNADSKEHIAEALLEFANYCSREVDGFVYEYNNAVTIEFDFNCDDCLDYYLCSIPFNNRIKEAVVYMYQCPNEKIIELHMKNVEIIHESYIARALNRKELRMRYNQYDYESMNMNRVA